MPGRCQGTTCHSHSLGPGASPTTHSITPAPGRVMFWAEGSSNITSATCCAQPRRIFHPELKETHQEVEQAEPAPSAITYIHVTSLDSLSSPTVRHPRLCLQLVETWTWKLQPRSNGVLESGQQRLRWSEPKTLPASPGGGQEEHRNSAAHLH